MSTITLHQLNTLKGHTTALFVLFNDKDNGVSLREEDDVD